MSQSAPSTRALLQNPAIRLLFASQTISYVGTWISLIALNVKIYDLTRSSLGVAVVLLLTAVPSMLAGLVGGVAVDRLNRQRLLVLADAFRAVVTLAILFTSSLPLLYALVFANALAGALFRMARMAIVPQLADSKETLLSINALLNLAQSLTLTLGPAAGGILVAAVGPSAAFALDALTFAISAGLIWRIALPHGHAGQLPPGKTWQHVREGLSTIRASRPLTLLILSSCGMLIGTGALNALEVVYAEQVLHTSETGYGLLVSAWGLGILLGTLSVSRMARLLKPETLFRGAMALLGVMVVCYAFAPGLPAAIAVGVVGGWGNGILFNLIQTLLQQLTPPAMMGRVAGSFGTATDLAIIASLLLSGLLSDVVGIQPVFVCSGILIALTAVLPALRRGAAPGWDLSAPPA